MLIRSPEERAAMWSRASASREREERERLIVEIGRAALEELRSEFDLYSGVEDEFVEAFVRLDEGDELLDPDMLRAFQSLATETVGAGRNFLRMLVARLAAIAEASDRDPGLRTRAADLYVRLRDHLGMEKDEWLSVAQVAEHFGVRAQTVYKWVEQGKLPASRSPGGGTIRIPFGAVQARRGTNQLTELAAKEALTIPTETAAVVLTQDVPYRKALEAIEAGRVPALPRRRYMPERAEELSASADASEAELSIYAEPTARLRNRPFDSSGGS